MTQRNLYKTFLSIVLTALFAAALMHCFKVSAQDARSARMYIDGAILDRTIIEEIKNSSPLAEFTAIICVEEQATNSLRVLWSMDDTGGPDCILNPPESGVFTEVRDNAFSLLLGGPSQRPLPEQLKTINRNNLKIFLFVSVNDEDWRLIVPFDYKFTNPDTNPKMTTIPARINVSFENADHSPTMALRSALRADGYW
ncbi:MAG: hypothetical protein HQM16_18890 [Deltaproteobacteria bacterium]|nr:hypothetical protein [Deltaproteobacteria bacterium]